MGGLAASVTAARIVLGLVFAFTVTLIAASRYVVPAGLAAPSRIPLVAGKYTAQISGFVDVPSGEAHHLGLSADREARLILDGYVIATVAGNGREFSTSPVAPDVHRVLIQFDPGEGRDVPDLYFMRSSGPDVPVPRAALSPNRLSPAAWTFRRHLQWLALLTALFWMGAAAQFGSRAAMDWFSEQLPATRAMRHGAWTSMAVAAAVFAYPVWWGVPIGWAEDELAVVQLTDLAQILAPGWYSRYPPMHMYVLAAVNAPILAVASLDMLDTGSVAVYSAMKIVASLVSVAMALGITALVFVCGSRAAGPRVGLLAGLIWTLTLPAAFYAKTTNLDIPYTFWFALSLVAYQRAIEHPTPRMLVSFAVAATVSVVTKDQAYGLFLFPAIHLAIARYRQLGRPAALVRDPAILGSLAAAVLTFGLAHNLLFNWQGFQEHVATITGGASQGYRMVDSASAAGQAWIFARVVQQIGWSMSWPGAVLALLGIVWAVRARARTLLGPFLIPAVSYYVTFIAVVGYSYDRFVIPICLLLAIFAGFALDRLWPENAPAWRTGVVGVVLAFMTLRTISINLLMAADGRYDVQRWMRANLPPRTHVAIGESRALLPELGAFQSEYLAFLMQQVGALRPEVIVISDNYRRRFPPDTPEAAWVDALLRGERGYQVVMRHRADVPLAILTRERQFRDPDPSFSVLHKVNPEIIVLRRKE